MFYITQIILTKEHKAQKLYWHHLSVSEQYKMVTINTS